MRTEYALTLLVLFGLVISVMPGCDHDTTPTKPDELLPATAPAQRVEVAAGWKLVYEAPNGGRVAADLEPGMRIRSGVGVLWLQPVYQGEAGHAFGISFPDIDDCFDPPIQPAPAGIYRMTLGQYTEPFPDSRRVEAALAGYSLVSTDWNPAWVRFEYWDPLSNAYTVTSPWVRIEFGPASDEGPLPSSDDGDTDKPWTGEGEQ